MAEGRGVSGRICLLIACGFESPSHELEEGSLNRAAVMEGSGAENRSPKTRREPVRS